MTTKRSEPNLKKHLIAGFGAGCVSTLALYPLDLVKIHFQVHEQSRKAYRSVFSAVSSIWRQGGTRALYRGMSPALYGSTVSWGLYFMFYERAKGRYSNWLPEGQVAAGWQHFISGIEAGAMCIPFTNPIWLIKVRMQVQAGQITRALATTPQIVPYKSVSDAFRRIVTEEGVLALYKGSIPALILTTHGAFKFVAYEKLKTVYYDNISPTLVRFSSLLTLSRFYLHFHQTIHHTLAIGSVAQAFASFMTYPYQVIKARIQQGGPAAEKYHGTIDCGRRIIRNEGVRGFYKGLAPNIMRVIPSGAISFAAYEKIASLLDDSE